MIRLSSPRTAVIILLLDKPASSRWGRGGVGAVEGRGGQGAENLASDQVVNREKKKKKKMGLWLKEISVVRRPNNWIIIVGRGGRGGWGVREG